MLLFILLQASSVYSSPSPHSCLMVGELYHEDTQTCFSPLSGGPCKMGEWIVLGGISGTGVCRSKVVCKKGEIPVLDQAGGAVCDCTDGKERVLGKCETLYTQGVCGEGEVLLPQSFNIGHKNCPSKFSCKTSDNCLAYKAANKQAAKNGTNERELQISFLKEMVCNKKAKTICCPEENSKSLFSPANLIQSLVTAKSICTKNPCSSGKWPWVGEDGISKCLHGDDGVENCEYALIEENGRLSCPWNEVRSVAPISGRKCRRRKRFINGRCARIFG